ncbi:hypothetical protein ABTZ93_43620 [Streptomyces sp. NPDC097941]|uniref:hypothetical protein n=1 Tax=Streptomyces sp. NPDC097941 TaxID=3155685 RepID=UPI0033230A7C
MIIPCQHRPLAHEYRYAAQTERSVLVKRRNGSLELITLLLPGDVILVPADITSVPGEGKVVAVLVLGTAIGARAARRRTAEVCP